MKTSINIDIGGTFTDCYVVRNGQQYYCKTPTTGYNLSIGFMAALRDVASQAGISDEELLNQAESICYSTTLAMNTLIQRKGARLALLLTDGLTQTHVLGKAAQFIDGATVAETRDVAHASKFPPLIPLEDTVGVKERVDCFGKIVRPLDEQDVIEKVHRLILDGVRGFVVCLQYSYLNPVHELRIRELINEEYPVSYLGAVPVVLSHEVLPRRYEYQRGNAAMLNAYLHQSMAEELRTMADELRDRGFRIPMLMVHNTGGVAEVFRTKALQTYNGGPVAGLMGSVEVAKAHGFQNVVVTDMGGTSFDLGLVVQGSSRFYAWQPLVERWMVDQTMIETISIGAGGGSIAHMEDHPRRLEVGPQSAGSMPGPACYDQGGTLPTVTDADLVLGYVNPEYFHGGQMFLNKEPAEEAIREKVAKPLGLSVVEAAMLIRRVIDLKMGDLIYKETVMRGFDPRTFALFAYGGAGPTHCCGYGFRAGVPRVIVFPLSPVFCAYGSSQLDFVHVWERSRHMALLALGTQKPILDLAAFNGMVEEMQRSALEEVKTEGLNIERVHFSLELEMRFGTQPNFLRCTSPLLFIRNDSDVRAVYEQFAKEYADVYTRHTVMPELGVNIENLFLKVIIPREKPPMPVYPLKGETPPREALKGKRLAYWEEYKDFRDTNVYEQTLLQPGNIIQGPAILEAPDTTVVVTPGTRLTITKYLSGVLERI